MNNQELNKACLEDIRELFEQLAKDNEEYSKGEYAIDYHRGKAQAFRLCAERIGMHTKLLEGLA